MLFAILTGVVKAEEIPFGVSPKEITVSGSIDFDEPHLLELSKGQLIQSYEYKNLEDIVSPLSQLFSDWK